MNFSKNKAYSLLFADDLLSYFIFKKYSQINHRINLCLKKDRRLVIEMEALNGGREMQSSNPFELQSYFSKNLNLTFLNQRPSHSDKI
jgi:hypothetical protein